MGTLVESIKNYEWKWLLELFYGVGTAAAVATAVFVVQNNPFEADPVDYDTFTEWKAWATLGAIAAGRAAWQAAAKVTTIVAEKVIGAFGPK